MPLIVFHTRRVREALAKPAGLGIDLIILFAVTGLLGILFMFGQEVVSPFQEKQFIDLRFGALPQYTLFSLMRGFAAYAISLAFTLVYGTIAAHSRRAEKVMIPLLDVLQAIPVLGFLPGLVLAMVSLFPRREIGLELACILMIFTGQAWNMVFSFHGSLKSIPTPLREVAAIHGLSGWKTFRLLELPAAMIGLVWNSMMSMAGGWFFLTVNEAFTLGNHDFRLPGIGSYMNEAINKGNTPAMIAAIIAMVVMIVVADQLFWRPIAVWSQRYKLEDTAESEKPQCWVLDFLKGSRLVNVLIGLFSKRPEPSVDREQQFLQGMSGVARHVSHYRDRAIAWSRWIIVAFAAGAALWGAIALTRLLIQLPLREPQTHADWLDVGLALLCSMLRTTAAVAIGAAWALPTGILIGLSPRWSSRLQPIIQVVASFPAPMLFPLVTMALLFLHVPFTIGCVTLMLLGAQWYILFNVIAGASAIPSDLKEVASVYRMDARQRWTKLYLPCVFPYLVTGLVTAAGGAWNATIVSEYVQIKGSTFLAFGLGSTISQATSQGNFPLLCAAVVTMAGFVVFINRLFWKRLYHLAEARFSLNV